MINFAYWTPTLNKSWTNVSNLPSANLDFTLKLGYNELGCLQHSVITNIFLSEISHFTTQINPVRTKKMAVPELFVLTEFEGI